MKTLIRASVLSACAFAALALLPAAASASAVSVTGLTATSTNVYVNTGLATTTRVATGDTVHFQLDLGGTPLIAPQINIFGMGSTTMSGAGAHWFYASTSVTAWTEGPLSFQIGVGGTAGDATSTQTQANITSGSNVTYDKTGPSLSSIAWTDTDGSTQISGTDTLTLTFSEVMATTTITTANIDTVLGLTNSHTFGTTGNGLAISWNTAGNKLTITLGTDTTATGADTLDPTTAVKDAVGNADATPSPVTLPDNLAPSTPTGLVTVTFQTSRSITLSSTGASQIRYTTDGSTPSCSAGTVYSAKFTVSQTTTVKAIACDEANNASSVATGVYTLDTTTSTGGTGSVGGSGGGGGGSSNTPATPQGPKTPGLSSGQIDSILAVLASFHADAAVIASVKAALTGSTTAQGGGSTVSVAVHLFQSDLHSGSVGSEVKALQQYLNAHGYPVAAAGAGSAGQETETFGAKTRAALILFQQSKGITPASGFLGPLTRAAINSGD